MAEVSIYVAVITAGAGIIGAAIPQVSMVLRDARKDRRDWRDRRAGEVRQACVDLLRATSELRTQIANNRTFQGAPEGMAERLEEVRQYAAAARLSATNVGLMVPERLAEPAERLAAAAASLADAAVRDTDLDLGRMTGEPRFQDLDTSMADFRTEAKAHALAIGAEPGRAHGLLARARRRDEAAAELDR
jgi:hypothetical protein